MIKAIFFDFDGVLTEDRAGWLTACRNIRRSTGLPLDKIKDAYLRKKKEHNMGEISAEEFWGSFCKNIGRTLEISLLLDAYKDIKINKPVFEISQKLRKKYKVGIISDNPKERFELISKQLKLDQKFDGLFISYMTNSLKNERKNFEFALKSFGYKPEECIFIDNSEKNLEIPEQMGFRTIHFDEEKNDVNKLKEDLKKAGVELI
jgi:HAD superfamily hydrolase (TIGR01509 family)